VTIAADGRAPAPASRRRPASSRAQQAPCSTPAGTAPLWAAAGLSGAAAARHALAAAEHQAEPLMAAAFVGVAVAQLALAVLVLLRPTAVVCLAGVVATSAR
jgi:hypothetical protein